MDWPRHSTADETDRRPGAPGGGARSGPQALGVKRVEWLQGEGLREWPEPHTFAEARVLSVTVPPIRIQQERSVASADPNYHLLFHLDGHGLYRTDGLELEQVPGDIVLLHASQPCEVIHPDGARVLRWTLPRARIAPFLDDEPEEAIHRLSGGRDAGGILLNYASDLSTAGDLPASTRRGLLEQLYALVGLTIEASHPAHERRVRPRAVLQRRLLAYVETHYRDPDLSASRAAADLGISRRWLHVLAADLDAGFADLVANRRLEESLVLLSDPDLDHQPISHIAFRAGFGDLSTYYRRFARRYGRTPGDARRRAHP